MSGKSMAEVIERHHMSHSDWDENQFAILCHCGTGVVGEDNGEEAYTQEEALYAGHLADALVAAGYGDVRAASNRVGKRYAELHQMLRDELQAAALEEAAAWLDNGEMAEVIAYEGPSNRGEVIAAYYEAIEDPQNWLRARAAAVRGEG